MLDLMVVAFKEHTGASHGFKKYYANNKQYKIIPESYFSILQKNIIHNKNIFSQ